MSGLQALTSASPEGHHAPVTASPQPVHPQYGLGRLVPCGWQEDCLEVATHAAKLADGSTVGICDTHLVPALQGPDTVEVTDLQPAI